MDARKDDPGEIFEESAKVDSVIGKNSWWSYMAAWCFVGGSCLGAEGESNEDRS